MTFDFVIKTYINRKEISYLIQNIKIKGRKELFEIRNFQKKILRFNFWKGKVEELLKNKKTLPSLASWFP